MRKFTLVVLAVLAMAVPASAQQYIPTSPEGWWYKIQGNQVMMLEADNLALINQAQRQGYRSLGPNLRWGGNAYGIPVGQGFYPMYDSNRQPLSGRQRIERGAGIIAIPTAIGAAVGGWKGGIIGAAIGGGVALLNDSRYRGKKNDNVVVPSPGQGGYVGSDGIPVATGTRPRSGAVQSSLGIGNQSSGLTRRAVNRTGMEVAVFETGADPSREEPLMVLTRGEGFEVPLNDGGYDVYILVPTNRLGVQDVRRATVVPNHNLDGWDIVVAP